MKRKVDDLGRIVLPDEYRSALNIKANDEVQVSLEADAITIKKPVLGCCLCHSSSNLARIGTETVCKACIQRLYEAKDDDKVFSLSAD